MRNYIPGQLDEIDGDWHDYPEFYDLRPIRYVLAATQAMSIRQAAENLGVEPSTVSRAIRDYEERIGTRLFLRGSFGVKLTEAGCQFLKEVIPALRQIGSAIGQTHKHGRPKSRTLKIGVVTTLAGGFLRHLLSSYEGAHPETSVLIHDGDNPSHIRNLRAHQLDIGFVTDMDEIGGLTSVQLWKERVYIAMPRSHPLSNQSAIEWDDIREEQFVVTRRNSGPEIREYILKRFNVEGVVPKISSFDVHSETLMQMVAMGKGLTPVLEAWRFVGISGVRFVPLNTLDDVVSFSAVWSPENINPVLQRMIIFAQKLAAVRSTTLSSTISC